MSTTVTSFFQSQMESTNPSSRLLRFTFNGSDISPHVLSYGTLSRNISESIGNRGYTIEIENTSQLLNSLMTEKAQFLTTGTFDYGFTTDTGSEETLQLFSGDLLKARFREKSVSLFFRDKLLRLKARTVGSDDTPVSFTSTNVNPADLVWWMATSYGNLSLITSTSNPDIDYASWETWKAIFTDNNTVVNARFTGENVVEIIEEAQEITDSVIYAEGDNKLYFTRWTGVSSDVITITDSVTTRIADITVEGTHITNKARVLIGYNPTSGAWAGEITRQNTTSTNSYGVFEKAYYGKKVWLVDSVSAINLADRIVARRREPNIKAQITTPIIYLNAQVGDEISLTSQVFSFSNKSFALLGYQIDAKNDTMTLIADEGFGKVGFMKGFILDDATWGLLDQEENPIL